MTGSDKRFAAYILLLTVLWAASLSSQEIPLNRYGLPVVNSVALYDSLVQKDSAFCLIDLKKFIPGIVLDIRYATENNFTGKVLYTEARAFARLPVAIALKKITEELAPYHFKLKVYDAYRPYSVTEQLWEYVQNENFAASPAKGSRHNRGCAIDLTLVDDSTEAEAAMPTPYDDFSLLAASDFPDLPPQTLQNRALLQSVMEKHGFLRLKSEWWHFDFLNWKNYPIINIPFREISENCAKRENK
jgi:D-alanyl-D-alanine dipeptidase